MVIHIDKRAEEYIKSKSLDKSIQIIVSKIGGGWCISYEPSVVMGKPTNENSFNLYKIGDINVYVLAGLKARDGELRISFNKLLWIKSLAVDGLVI